MYSLPDTTELSSVFAAYITGFADIRSIVPITSRCFSVSSASRAGMPALSAASRTSRVSASAASDGSPFICFLTLSRRRSAISMSDSISSVFTVSMSRFGSASPSTCITSEPPKHLTTCTIASTLRMCERNLLPRPSPFDAPLTRPAISTNSIVA